VVAMGKRQRKRRREGGPGGPTPATTDYPAPAGGVLTLRDEMSEGTLNGLRQLESRPAATAEDRWQRRTEYLFERLAVRWELSGLPISDQAELLGRFRMASAEERLRVREALAEHLRTHYPEVDV